MTARDKRLCVNCGEPGSHFVPTSFGDEGFFACVQINAVNGKPPAEPEPCRFDFCRHDRQKHLVGLPKDGPYCTECDGYPNEQQRSRFGFAAGQPLCAHVYEPEPPAVAEERISSGYGTLLLTAAKVVDRIDSCLADALSRAAGDVESFAADSRALTACRAALLARLRTIADRFADSLDGPTRYAAYNDLLALIGEMEG